MISNIESINKRYVKLIKVKTLGSLPKSSYKLKNLSVRFSNCKD